ncbi:MAG: M48 family metalloprotease, partial [Spirochaetia bacterium]|nr:M48 family metalloprotease [Spirochaetia bacterium]
MKAPKTILFTAVLTTGAAWITFVSTLRENPALPESLAPLFQLAGKAPRSLDRTLTRTLPVDDLDEKAYGDAIYSRYVPYSDTTSKEQRYVQTLLKQASATATKPFEYRVLLSPETVPNAYALPGGVIIVTAGLLSTLESEDELLAVLGHEVGHVEAGHCLNTVRFQLTAKKVGAAKMGELADMAVMILTRHSYSKTDEAQADDYGYEFLTGSQYNPGGAGRAFQRLLNAQRSNFPGRTGGNVVTEYFQTHPYLEHRVQKFTEQARLWRQSNPAEKRYIGRGNLKDRRTKDEDERA